MPGLDPGIHLHSKVVDCRVKPGNDGEFGTVIAIGRNVLFALVLALATPA
jgi:hypothetical protein